MNAGNNRIIFTFLFVFLIFTEVLIGQESWKIAGDKITTSWSAAVDPKKPLSEYPRPQMQ